MWPCVASLPVWSPIGLSLTWAARGCHRCPLASQLGCRSNRPFSERARGERRTWSEEGASPPLSHCCYGATSVAPRGSREPSLGTPGLGVQCSSVRPGGLGTGSGPGGHLVLCFQNDPQRFRLRSGWCESRGPPGTPCPLVCGGNGPRPSPALPRPGPQCRVHFLVAGRRPPSGSAALER